MIKFKKIKYKNILSTGNQWTEIKLDEYPDTLIVGKNGAGKSTMLDAICFALFGKAFRKINKPNLVNSINAAGLEVHFEFSIGTKNYRIERGIKPNIFLIFCNEELLNQDSKAVDYQAYLEKTILKFNFKSFTQIDILGSASFVPFMQLSVADRRAIIEELLDIEIFSTMNLLNKEKLASIKEDIIKNKYEKELIEHKIKFQETVINENREHDKERINELLLEITNTQTIIEDKEKEISKLKSEIETLDLQTKEKKSIQDKVRTLLQLESKIETNIVNIDKEIYFLCNTENCPTCRQKIVYEFRTEQTEERELKKKKYEDGLIQLQNELHSNNKLLTAISVVESKINDIKINVSGLTSTNKSLNANIGNLNRQILALKNKSSDIGEDTAKLLAYQRSLLSLEMESEALSVDKHYFEHASLLLKDTGVKTNIVRQYLPVINKMINGHLEDLGLFINFNFDENFKETIKSRHRDEFVYENFSEGEKQRIDLALLFTWRAISKMKNSHSSNLLILDEIFDRSIDDIDTLMDILKRMLKDINMFVISHKTNQIYDKYKNVIHFEKKNNFSYMMEK